MRKLPGGPVSFVISDVLTWPGKLSVFGEPFRRAKRDDEDESVFSFASRRIGPEAARVLVDAMVTGIYAGDSSKLSLEATFPKMYRMERDHGGLVKARFAKKRGAKGAGGGPAGPGGRLTSFREGLEELPATLARAIGPSFRPGIGARAVADMGVRGFRVKATEGAPVDADAVVLACPSWHAAEMLKGTDDRLAAALAEYPLRLARGRPPRFRGRRPPRPAERVRVPDPSPAAIARRSGRRTGRCAGMRCAWTTRCRART